jgi:hypothetical protein
LGRLAVTAFLVHERIRASRRKKHDTESRLTIRGAPARSTSGAAAGRG